MFKWKTEQRSISDLSHAPYNPRTSTPEEEKQLKTSLSKFSLADPIVINANNRVIGGHFRLRVLKGQGEKTVDVRVPDRILTEAEEKELNLRLNRNTGQWDFAELANFDEDLLKDVGFSEDELQKMFGDIENEGQTDPDAVPEVPEEPKTKLGDLYKLGEHRLLCGDSTKREDVERVMGGEKADMVFTDPPYGVNFKYNKYDDKKTKDEHREFCRKWFDILKTQSDFLVITIGFGNEHIFYEFDKNFHHLVWYKKFGLSASPIAFARRTEQIFVLGKPPKKRYDSDFFEFGTDREKGLHEKHPCPKPVAFLNALIDPQTDKNSIVLDVFGGSGTTIIACEKTNRKARLIEIDPHYCDVIIKRWEDFTGKKSEKL